MLNQIINSFIKFLIIENLNGKSTQLKNCNLIGLFFSKIKSSKLVNKKLNMEKLLWVKTKEKVQ